MLRAFKGLGFGVWDTKLHAFSLPKLHDSNIGVIQLT